MTVSDHLDILIVEDNPGDKKLVDKQLERTDTGLLADTYDLYHEETLEAGIACLESHSIDVMLLDLGLPGSTGIETMSTAKAHAPNVPVIVLTGNDDTAIAIEAINEGAQDYLPKGELTGHQLARSIRYAVEREHKEQELRAERDFLDSVIESLPYPFYVIDVEDYTVEHANSKASVTEGNSCHVLSESSDQSCPEALNAVKCPIPAVRETGETVTVDHEHLDENGVKRAYRVFGTPITEEGEVTKMAESTIDITNRVQYAQQLEDQRDKLKLLNQVVRHDIRNELQLIDAYAEMIGTEANAEYLEIIRESSDNAIGLTKTARHLSKVMVSDEVELVEMHLSRVLQTQITKQSESFTEATFDVGTLDQVVVMADEMLPAVFRNLLKNAVIHNDKEEPVVTVTTNTMDTSVTVRIGDNGPGIPDDYKDEIFGEGEQGLDSDGTGIGLYLVCTLTERYEGDVWVEDNDPEGTVFVVELPRANCGRPE